MFAASKPDTLAKLDILSRDSQYDLACSCSSSKDQHRTRGPGGKWIYPVTMGDGRRTTLLKTLISNHCTSDCKYCPLNCHSSSVRRTTLEADSLAKIFMDYYSAGQVFGLFLSSGIIQTADKTMDHLISTAEILRQKYRFNGYIHLKIIPGSSPAAIERAVALSNAVSLNIETPGAKYLQKLSGKKDFFKDIVEPMRLISKITSQSRRKVKQTTQFIVGPAAEPDKDIIDYTAALYDRAGLSRVYFSAWQDSESDSNPDNEQSFIREHRLYQADFLLRKYGFSASEIIYDDKGLLSQELDPKQLWAISHPEFFPVNINTADRYALLRVPGLGTVTVSKILQMRKMAKIGSIDDIVITGNRLLKAEKYLYFGDSAKNSRYLF